MPLRTLFLLLITGLYFWACQYYMTCQKVQVCYNCGSSKIIAEPAQNDVLPLQESPDLTGIDKPLVFTSSSSDPIINNQFFFYKESISGRMKSDNILEITGKYYEEEVNDSDFENLGLARAHEIRKLFLDKIPKEKIRLKGSLYQEKKDPEIGFFESADFFWVKPNEEVEAEIPVDDFAVVIETANQATIYFPFNSTSKNSNSAIDDYLDQLVLRIKQSGEKVLLTGHTDDIGKAKVNDVLALRRAKKIRDILLSKGVKRKQIFTETKGESEPVVPNNSTENRRKNRRTVIKVIGK